MPFYSRAVADPGEGPGGPVPPLFLDQAEAKRAEKIFLETDQPPPPPTAYLRVWMIPTSLSRSGSATVEAKEKKQSRTLAVKEVINKILL